MGAEERGPRALDYGSIFKAAIDRLHDEGRYRVFIDILRTKGSFPNAHCFHGHNGPKPITVWCSNDYLGMGQHPTVMTAMQGDKKRRAGRVGFVLVEAPGDVRIGMSVSPDDLRAAVAAGATRVGVVRAITEAADPEAAARAFRARLG